MKEYRNDKIAHLLLQGKTCRNCAYTYDPNQGCSHDQFDSKMKYSTCIFWCEDNTPNICTYSNISDVKHDGG